MALTVTYTVPAGHLIRVTASATQYGEVMDVGTGLSDGIAAGAYWCAGPFDDVQQFQVFTESTGAPMSVEVFLLPQLGTTAAAGSTQANAEPLAVARTVKVTGADGTKGVRLPPAFPGSERRIVNPAASALKVYPASGDWINAQAEDTALTMAAYSSALFVAYDFDAWHTVPTVPS